MTEVKGGLGRGLSALLPQEVRLSGPQLREIALDEIKPNARQPRAAIDEEALGELAAAGRVETPGWEVFARLLFDRMHYGADATVAALSVVMLAAVTASAGVVVVIKEVLTRRGQAAG